MRGGAAWFDIGCLVSPRTAAQQLGHIARWASSIAKIENLKITFDSFEMTHSLTTPEATLDLIAAHYSGLTRSWSGTLMALWQLGLGSLELQDNPLGLGELAKAVLGVYRIPRERVRQRSTKRESMVRAAVAGCAQGSFGLGRAVARLVPSLLVSKPIQFVLATCMWDPYTNIKPYKTQNPYKGVLVGAAQALVGLLRAVPAAVAMEGPRGLLPGVRVMLLGCIGKPFSWMHVQESPFGAESRLRYVAVWLCGLV